MTQEWEAVPERQLDLTTTTSKGESKKTTRNGVVAWGLSRHDGSLALGAVLNGDAPGPSFLRAREAAR